MAEKNTQVESAPDETDELKKAFARRHQIDNGEMEPEKNRVVVKKNSMSVYYDNPEMDKTTIDKIKEQFEQYDLDKNGLLDEYELSLLFEKLKVPKLESNIRSLPSYS